MMLISGFFSGSMKQQQHTYTQTNNEEKEEENKERKSCRSINTKIQIKMGKPTKRMREKNYERS